MRGLILTAALLGLLGAAARAVTIVDTGGFEGYAPGNIAGQNGWVQGPAFVGTAARPITQVDIAAGPGASGNVIQFNNVVPGQAAIYIPFADLNGQYKLVRTSFDFYRETSAVNNNMDWWPRGSNPWWGIAWDTGPDIVPFFNGSDNSTGFVRQQPNTWYRIEQIWDLENGRGWAWVNGVQVANNLDIGTGAFTGWYFNDWQTLGTVGHRAYIDNLVILAGNDPSAIPEPSSLALLAGALPLLGLRRRKAA